MHRELRARLFPPLAGILCFLLNACSVTGPTAIRNGGLAYNEAITRTKNQQTLMAIVHNRYLEESNLLAISSVTANVRVSTSAGVQLGFGDDENFAGNLVPFSATAVYEENPTISYRPVEGTKYLNQFMSPVPLATLAQITSTVTNPAPLFHVLIASINGVDNPDFLFPSIEPDPRFARIVVLMTELSQAHDLNWAAKPGGDEELTIVIKRDTGTNRAKVDELLSLLGLPAAEPGARSLLLPVALALDGRESQAVGITTRSVYRLMEILTAAVEVPARDQADGRAAVYPQLGPVGRELKVRYSDGRPDDAAVAVPHRDGWFYIDDRDPVTKGYFRILIALWSATISDSTAGSAGAPVLTVPVSR